MGNFHRCPRIWAVSGRNSRVPAFGDTLFGVHPDEDASEMPELTKDGSSTGDLWGEFGCAWHCPACVEQLHRDPLTLASTWLRAVVADNAQAVPRIADTAVYVTTARVLSAVCGVVAAKGGVVAGGSSGSTSSVLSLEVPGLTAPCTGSAWKSSETPSVAPVYSDILRLLEDAWRKTADPRRCRPFLRLWSGRLLQLKFVVELCFGEAFAPAPYPARLSALAIRVLAALEAHDAAALWAALQLLGDPERRASVVGPSGDGTESGAACVMLQLQGYTALLLHPLRPLETCGCSVEEALRRMTTATDALVATARGEVCWLGTWQLVHCADRTFRHVCQHISGESSSNGATTSDIAAMQSWAVRSVESAAVWRCGDPYAAIVAIYAVRTLILWRGLLLQQEQSTAQGMKRSVRRTQGRSELLKVLERTLSGVASHCAAATGAGGDAAAEARAVSMLLNDHHLAGAPQLAAQQPCLLHGRKNSLESDSSIAPAAALITGQADSVRSSSKQDVPLGLESGASAATGTSVPMGFSGEDTREAARAAMGFGSRGLDHGISSQAVNKSSNSKLAAPSTALPADGAAFCALLDSNRTPSPTLARDAPPTDSNEAAMPAAEMDAAVKPAERPASRADSAPDSPTDVAAVVDAAMSEDRSSKQAQSTREQFHETRQGQDSAASTGVLSSDEIALASEARPPEQAATVEGGDPLVMPSSDSAPMVSDAEAMPADGDVFERMCSEIVAQNENPINSVLLSE